MIISLIRIDLAYYYQYLIYLLGIDVTMILKLLIKLVNFISNITKKK